MAGEKILLVDDEKEINDLVSLYLCNEGFDVVNCDNGNNVLELVRNEQPDLIVLDVLLPGLDGFEVCQELRKESDIPLIFLSCKSEDMDKILGLMVGGDDYITKPFNPKELVARIKAHLRRSRMLIESSTSKSILKFPGLSIDLNRHEVSMGDKRVSLSTREFEILVLLAQNPNRVFTYEQILRFVWNTKVLEHDSRTVMVHISNLRKKIEPDHQNPVYILTVRGVGYKFGQAPIY